MTRFNSPFYKKSHSDLPKKTGRNPWITFLKVICWCVGILAVLCGVAIWIISYYLSPGKITELIEKKSSEYLRAEIEIGKLEYKLFRTYPWLEFEIDSLRIISKSLDGLPDSIQKELPPDSEFLAFVAGVKGRINVHDLLHDHISLKGIEVLQPSVNLVIVNDSIGNFNILRTLPKVKKVPEFDVNDINITAPIDLRFFSLIDDMEGSAKVDSFYLTEIASKDYQIGFEGIMNGRYKEYSLPSEIPLKFDTGLKIDLNSLAVRLRDLSLSMAGLAFEAKGEVTLNNSGMDIREANFNIRIVDIFEFLQFLPSQIKDMISLPKGLSGILPLNLTVHILSPYHLENSQWQNFSFEDLPSMVAEVKVDDANLLFSPPHGKKISADDIYFEGIGRYYPSDTLQTSLQITELRMHGEGISLDMTASADNLLGEKQDIKGNVLFNSTLMESLSYFFPNSGIKLAGLLKGKVDFTGQAHNLGKDGFKEMVMKGEIDSKSLNLTTSSVGNIRLRNLKGNYHARVPAYPLTDYKDTKLFLDLEADTVASISKGMRLFLTDLLLKLDALDTVSGNPDPTGDLLIGIGGLHMDQNKTELDVGGVDIKISGSLNASGASTNYNTVAAVSPGDDEIIASRIKHTPLVVEYEGGGILQTIMNLAKLEANLSAGGLKFKSPSYLYPVKIRGLTLNTDLNNLKFSVSYADLARTSFAMSGSAEGLQPFLTSYSATPLKAKADINFENVDINQLSWGYYGALLAQGNDSVFVVSPMTPFTAADSVCVVIPRNIDATLRLHSNAAEYLQYSFSPLSTDIIVKNGNATLSDLTVGAPYCTAIVNWTYATSNLDDIFMDLKAKVKNFEFTPFYAVFPSLVDKSPELKNFTGVFDTDVNCHFRMFPDMFMDSESLKGNFEVQGREMEFARQGKIERITHLLLIQGDQPIKIQNIDITGGYHDNLLQLNPFKISFDGYELEVAGVNNTSGNMYYHLALEKSPFHLPFGVSLVGKFRHPEVRVGGTRINDYKAEMVGMDPYSSLNVNIMAWLKHGWLLFVQEAAKFEQAQSVSSEKSE